jgi:hypothetical protein
MRNHKKLKTKARKLLTKEEIKKGTPIFLSKAWDLQKENKKNKHKKNART